MKKTFLALIIALVPALAIAQLELTPKGFQSMRDGKGFVVLDSEKSQQELFNESLTYLNGLFENPVNSISKVDGHSITVNGFSPRTVRSRYKKLKYTYDLDYSVTFEFKEGKVKYEVISWQAGPLVNVGDYKALKNTYGVYSDSLELQNEAAKESLESFFNGFLTLYDQSVLKKEDW